VTARRDVADLSEQVTQRTSELQQIDQRIQEARQNLMNEQQGLAQLREQIAQQAAELQALEQRREAPAPAGEPAPEQPAPPAQQ
jgi:peptidoglycan hydrolase CwlO-like protein